MKRVLPCVWVAALLMVMAGCAVRDQVGAAAASEAKPLCVMTFNLRFASAKPPNAWPQRRPVMRDCIRSISPDLIGTQEGVYQQLKDLAADLPEYKWLGLGREGGSHGEFMAIFYRKDRFEPLEYDHYWLSDTPQVIGSSSWGNTVKRMVTWVRFLDRSANRQFYLINTHLDHQVQAAREKGAALILERSGKLNPALPILLTGDFNAVAKANRAYDILTQGGFFDTWYAAAERKNEDVNSFHNYKGPARQGERIDWILFRGPVVVQSAEIATFSKDGQYPSDHFPVAARIRWGEGKP